MQMIRMGVGVKYGVEAIHVGVQQLLAQIGRGIDEYAGVFLLHQDRWPEAPVSGVFGIAGAPVTADQWGSAGMAAAKDRDAH